MTSYVVGIVGGSASGKTYLLQQLSSAFDSNQLTLISQDNYYKDHLHEMLDDEGKVNFDHPNSMQLELFYDHLRRILAGDTVRIREYTFFNPNITPRTFEYKPAPIIVLEGLFVYTHPEVNKRINLRLFVEAEEHIRLSRRIVRDINERNYPLENTIDVYQRQVVPMYRRFVEPYKHECDLIIPNNLQQNHQGVAVIVNHLRQVLAAGQ